TLGGQGGVEAGRLPVQPVGELRAGRLLHRILHLGGVGDLAEAGLSGGVALVGLLASEGAGDLEGVGARGGRDEEGPVVAGVAEVGAEVRLERDLPGVWGAGGPGPPGGPR